jgi:CBS domain-containing protein
MDEKSKAPVDNGSSNKNASEPARIRARDVLSTSFVEAPVIFVAPEKSVRDIALLLAAKKISAVPVVEDGKIVGIVSEGDLIRRYELGVETNVAGQSTSEVNSDHAKSRGKHARDIMTRTVVTVSEDTSLAEIVETLLSKNIRRVLVMRDTELVGVVSRSDIVRVLAARPEDAREPMSGDDDIIRFKVIETLMSIPGTSPWLSAISVSNGVVELTGTVQDENAWEPSRIAIENIPNVVKVNDRRAILQPFGG